MIPLYERVEVFYDKGNRNLRASKNFHQGELILYSFDKDDFFSIGAAIQHSDEPNASIRRDRVIAWRCIEQGEDITLDYKEIK